MKSYVGFLTLGDLVSEFVPGKPVNVEAVTQQGRPDRRFGIAHNSELITVSQIQGEEILYFRAKIGGYTMVPGGPLGEGAHYERSKSAETLTIKFLNDRGITKIRKAGISFPTSYIHTLGSIDYMHYDKASDRFVPIVEKPPF